MKRQVVALFLAFLMVGSIVGVNLKTVGAAEPKPLNVIIVWHQHQPYYYDPVQDIYTRPWVRLHAANNYWKMAHYLSEYPDVHVAIDLSGSLIAQLVDYMDGKRDNYQIITEKIANGEPLTVDEKWFMLQAPGGFFDHTIPWNGEPITDPNGNPTRDFWDRYTELKDKMLQAKAKYANLPLEEQKAAVTGEFTEQDYIDLAVLFNLAWTDYGYIMDNPELKAIYEKVDEGGYTRDDVKTVLDAQMWLLNHTFEGHEKINYLLGNGNVEVTVVPYAHPIGPILNDFGWENDFDEHVKVSHELYKEYLGGGSVTPVGGWAAESALNDKTLEILAENGWTWVMTDQLVLDRLGVEKTTENYYKPWVAEFNGKKIYLFPRDHALSDRVGFTYGGMNQYQAVEDFVNELLKVQKENYDGSLVYVVTLDGENAWENYPYDGKLFLNELYKKLEELQEQGLIRTVTPSEYIKLYGEEANVLTPKMMERLDLTGDKVEALLKAQSLGDLYDMVGVKEEMQWPESSWIDGTLSTWIGEPQENYGWYWLYQARKALMEHKGEMSQADWEKAYEYLLRAEASDWFWWYGSDQDSGQDYSFDRYLKAYLYEMYRLAGLEPPSYLHGNYFPDGEPYQKLGPIGLKKGEVQSYSSLSPKASSVSVYFDDRGVHFVLNGDVDEFEVSLYEARKRVGNTFTLLQKKPDQLRYSLWPFSADSVGLMITKHVVYRDGKAEIYNATGYEESEKLGDLTVEKSGNTVDVTVPFEYIETPNDFYFAASTVDGNGNLDIISTPVELKLPTEVKGVVIADVKDPEGDDHGPGTYTYPTDGVFKPGVFDLLEFKLLEQTDAYVMQFKFKDLGGNPWNGPNGFSLQIIEVYFDYKDGGNSSAIKMFQDGPGSNVNLDPDHPWDVAFRIAGWDYGNLIVLPDGTAIQGEMQISADPASNTITVKVPKKYIQINEDYGLWGDVLIGSQDGYGPDKWRVVAVDAEQWKLGGADPQAVINGVAPRVVDELVPEGFKPTQEEQLSSYDANGGKLATVRAIPLLKQGIVVNDPEGDDHGPGTYTYPTDGVFKPGVFDLLRFKMTEGDDAWTLEFYFKDLGGNPWNGPNGFSLQIIEAYFDYTEGGNVTAIKMFPDGPGSNVQLDPRHPWDVALRIAGWDYGNLIIMPDGTVYQGEMQISADPTKNAIIVKLPKKYLPGVGDYGLYASVLVGSQDGYGPDKWRVVAVEAEQWKLGGAEPDAVINGVAPRVVDELVPEGFKPTQEEQLSSYDAENMKLATVVMIPLVEGSGGEVTPTPTETTSSTSSTSSTTSETTTSPSSTTQPTTNSPTTTTTGGGGGICGPAALIGLAIIPLLLRRRR
ncbi:glucodextranase DOMON-like domain-containing protein [Thermococcus pacificus]|uniref:Amylopullulanase n=1 Tax=Thermococcus pacificus TaxID=71998 RepID=A0A218P6D1_9EURY|nr:glucodextranase DOMON-like domain-containing protein [Thermococcus pacificus]ASJ06337.1 amylopullulanase [Thermococcus pacificus]